MSFPIKKEILNKNKGMQYLLNLFLVRANISRWDKQVD